MSNRFAVEGVVLGACAILALMEGPLPLLVGIVGVIVAEVSIAKMKKSGFVGGLDRRADRWRGKRR